MISKLASDGSTTQELIDVGGAFPQREPIKARIRKPHRHRSPLIVCVVGEQKNAFIDSEGG